MTRHHQQQTRDPYAATQQPKSRRLPIAASLMAIAVALVMLAATTVTQPASANAAWFWTEVGSTGLDSGQTYTAVDHADQTGTQDDWLNYVEFMLAADGAHRSVFLIQPQGVEESMTIRLNYRGPDSSQGLWELLLIDQTNQSWVPVWSSGSMPSWVWTADAIEVRDAWRYLDQDSRVVAIWRTVGSSDVSQLDALTIGGTVVDPPPTTTPPTTAPPTTTPPTTTPPTTAPPTTTPPTTAPPTTTPPTTAPPTTAPPGDRRTPPRDMAFDYQIDGRYDAVPDGVGSVSRDWYLSDPAPGVYSICYVNAFQTQPDTYAGDSRPDLTSNWPAAVVTDIMDPGWPGEYFIDIGDESLRATAAQHVGPMIDTCASKGFDAVEFDNLDTWYRLDDMGMTGVIDRSDTVAYAKTLADYARSRGMAVAQKNAAELFDNNDHTTIGFDFAIVESCGEYDECERFASTYGDNIVVVEYEWWAFSDSCARFGDRFPISIIDPDGTHSFCR